MASQNQLLTDFTMLKTSNDYINTPSRFSSNDLNLFNKDIEHLINSLIFWDKIIILDDSGYGLGDEKIIESPKQRFDIQLIYDNPNLKQIINIEKAPRDFSIIDFIQKDPERIKTDILSVSQNESLRNLYDNTFKPTKRFCGVEEINKLGLPKKYLPSLAQYYRTYLYMQESHEKNIPYSPHEVRKTFLDILYGWGYEKFRNVYGYGVDEGISNFIENAFKRCKDIDEIRMPSFLEIFIADEIEPTEFIKEAFSWRKKFKRFRSSTYLKYIQAKQKGDLLTQKRVEYWIDDEIKKLFKDYKQVRGMSTQIFRRIPSLIVQSLFGKIPIDTIVSASDAWIDKYDLKFLIDYTEHAYSKNSIGITLKEYRLDVK